MIGGRPISLAEMKKRTYVKQQSESKKGFRAVLPYAVVLATAAVLDIAYGFFAHGIIAFSGLRFIFIAGIGALLVLFRPSSPLYAIRIDWSNAAQRVGLIAIPICVSLLLFPFSQLTGQGEWLEAGPSYWDEYEVVQDGSQYNYLADALIAGRVSLDLPKSDVLLSMDNPYDTPLRTQLNADKHEPIYWDYAFYDGEYYCYFGVLPCLLMFVPFKLVTGMDLRTDYAVVVVSILVVWALFRLLRVVQRSFFKNVSVGSFIVALVAVYLMSGVFEQAFFPRLYALPILSAYFFSTLALSFWFEAKRISIEEDRIDKRFLTVGAICAGCTLACRPQYIVVAFLALPIFWSEIRNRLFFSRKGIANTASIILPIVLLAIPVMLYNYARFDSFTNFRASYNLTGADMTAYTFVPSKIFLQTLEYLFLPLIPQPSFPFVETINSTGFRALYTNEPFYAGFVFLNPVLLLVFGVLLRKHRDELRLDWDKLPVVLGGLLAALFVIVVASSVSGVNMRYFADFSLYLIVAFLLCFWSFSTGSSKDGTRSRATLDSIAWAGCLLGALMYGLTFFGVDRFGALVYSSPDLFQAVAAMF